MTRKERISLMKEIEKIRKSKVISYFVGDRPNLPPASIADDAVRIIYNHLEKLGETKSLDLFIYTRGGNMMASFRIARLLREYCKKLGAIVPYRAHSGGTQICLAADEIVMSKLGELSPIDPSTGNPFNPVDRNGRPVPISVEDVRSYLKLAEEKAGLVSEESKLQIFSTLTEIPGVQTHPLALGNVNRVYDEVRLLVDQLLSIHMDPDADSEKIKKIKKQLTEVYTHSYAITRSEAINMGLKVEKASPQLEKIMMSLLDKYAEETKINEPFFADDVLGDQDVVECSETMALIETTDSGSQYQADLEITRIDQKQPLQTLVNLPIPPFEQQSSSPAQPVPSQTKTRIRFKRAKWVDIE